MIILPNKFERYCFCLRNTLQNLILKNGYKTKYSQMLMKIHKAEALFSRDFVPTNVELFSSEILNAVKLKQYENNKKFNFKTDEIGTVILNKKLFTALLLNLAKSSDKIEISVFNNRLLIKAFKTKTEQHKKLIKALGGAYFFVHHTDTLAVLIAAERTEKAPQKEIKDWEYLLNPLSVVNIYLS